MHFRLAVAILTLLPAYAQAGDYECLMEPWQLLKLAAPVTGLVDSVAVDRGDIVHKGQVVAHLEAALEEAQAAIASAHAMNDHPVVSARARMDFLQRKLSRNVKLKTTDAVSFAQLDESSADYKVAEAQLQEAQLNLGLAQLDKLRAEAEVRRRQIISPVDGIVTERTLGPGEYRTDQASVMTVAQIDPIRVETFLPLAVYGKVKVGDHATITPEAPVGGSYTATVTVVDKVLDAASGTIGVRLELPNPKDTLPVGIHCHVAF